MKRTAAALSILRRSSRASLKRLLAAALLAVAVLGGQQAAVLHWLSHSIDAARVDKAAGAAGSAVADHCDACLAFSALGSGARCAEAAALLPAAGLPAPVTADLEARPTPCRLPFQSRAPPVLV